jgi:hypothetical protein
VLFESLAELAGSPAIGDPLVAMGLEHTLCADSKREYPSPSHLAMQTLY